jgi:hypothetical protein
MSTAQIGLSGRLMPDAGGVVELVGQSFPVLHPNEYFFLVLTNRPGRFARLQVADWVGGGGSGPGRRASGASYRVVIPEAEGLLPVPETVLNMTSIAVVLWDDVSEDALTPDQQTALADWLRFGGRLIVNGPQASEAVANTALAEVLPLIPSGRVELNAQAATDLLRANAVATDTTVASQSDLLRSNNSRIVVDGRLTDAAQPVAGTASLVLERPTGRGTVIQPRFDLTDEWLARWSSYDSFFNSVLLRRPPREYASTGAGFSDPLAPAAESASAGKTPAQYFVGTELRSDGAVNTRLRFEARDRIFKATGEGKPSQSNSAFDPHYRNDPVVGLASWNESSDVMKRMRATLTEEAGIEIPDSSLVVRLLAIYLVLLVPVNYVVFRLLNRLEYAWLAVPLLALLGAGWAARQAQLDIGFVRSNTELALLEAHGGWPRAHLTRVMGIYNSLSSRYRLQFPTADGVATPLRREPDPGTGVTPTIQVAHASGPALADFAVPSNRMRYVHAEQIVKLGGPIELADGALVNRSGMDLLDTVVVRKDVAGGSVIASAALVAAGESKSLEFRSAEAPVFAEGLPMQTGPLMQRLADPRGMPAGATRLIARLDGPRAGLVITPPVRQHAAQTVVLVHLNYPAPPSPRPDRNLAGDVTAANSAASPTTADDGQRSEATVSEPTAPGRRDPAADGDSADGDSADGDAPQSDPEAAASEVKNDQGKTGGELQRQ